MFIRTQNDNYISKVKIEIGQFFGEDASAESITLREPTTLQYLKVQESWKTENDSLIMSDFYEMLPSLIVAHTLYETETTKMDEASVADLIFGKLECATEVMKVYFQFLADNQKKTAIPKTKLKR